MNQKGIITVAVVHTWPGDEQSPYVRVYQILETNGRSYTESKRAWERAIDAFRARNLPCPDESPTLGTCGLGWTVVDIIEQELAIFRYDLRAQGLEFICEVDRQITFDNI